MQGESQMSRYYIVRVKQALKSEAKITVQRGNYVSDTWTYCVLILGANVNLPRQERVAGTKQGKIIKEINESANK